MKCIELTKGKVAIVDDEDFERVAQWRWHVSSQGYATRKDPATRKSIMMHRVIMDARQGVIIDHKNRDQMDNRRCNLRVATHAQNAANSKSKNTNQLGIKGVKMMKDGRPRPYMAQMTAGGKHFMLGYFATPEEAHSAYCSAATTAFGEFARFN